jgi:hypothetical protein
MRSKESRAFIDEIKNCGIRAVDKKGKELLKMQFKLEQQKQSLDKLLKE